VDYSQQCGGKQFPRKSSRGSPTASFFNAAKNLRCGDVHRVAEPKQELYRGGFDVSLKFGQVTSVDTSTGGKRFLRQTSRFSLLTQHFSQHYPLKLLDGTLFVFGL
jgi:hypothetical protein